MQKQKNVGINAALNVIKQGLSIVFPLITYPYALRILGPVSMGKVGYGQSIISYFTLLAALGMANYSVREGAKRKKNKEDFQRFVNEIFSINVIFTIISYALLIAMVFFVSKFKEYRLLILLQSLSILFATLGVDWVNVIFEDYFITTVRSIFTHLISMVLLFLFIHKPEDYILYALLTVVTNGIICIWNFFYCRKYVKVHFVFNCNFKEHFKPMLILFANSVAVTIYINFDTTMLGWMKGDYYVGLYSTDVKIYSIIKNLLAAVYVVSIPRFAAFVGDNNFIEYKKLYSRMWKFLSLILLPTGVGIACVARELLDLMGGKEYADSAVALQILAFALIFAVYGGLVTGCYNIVNGYEKRNLFATVTSALLNFGLNLIAIPLFLHNGAAFTTMISEGFVMLFCFIKIEDKGKILDKKAVLHSILHALCGCIGIVGITILGNVLIPYIAVRFIVIVFSSVIFYLVVLFVTKDETLMEVLDGLKRKKSRLIKK